MKIKVKFINGNDIFYDSNEPDILSLHPWKFKMGQKSQNKLTKFDRFKPCIF